MPAEHAECRESLPFTAMLGSGFDVPADDAGNGAATAKSEGPAATFDLQVFLVQMASAFVGGLILNLMPCVLPVISLKILAFVQQAGESRGRVFLLNVWYSLGLLSVFVVLAALAAGVGMATGERLGWGEQFTDVRFKITMTALVFVMALSFLGVWEIPIPGFVGTGRAGKLQTQEGPSGAFFKGVFTTILATPCSGPFLGPVFGYVLKQPPYMAYCIFGAIGLGMASPYLLIGAFPALIRFLPKPGEWMDTFKQLMGFLLLATVVYLFNTLTSLYVLPTMTLLNRRSEQAVLAARGEQDAHAPHAAKQPSTSLPKRPRQRRATRHCLPCRAQRNRRNAAESSRATRPSRRQTVRQASHPATAGRGCPAGPPCCTA